MRCVTLDTFCDEISLSSGQLLSIDSLVASCISGLLQFKTKAKIFFGVQSILQIMYLGKRWVFLPFSLMYPILLKWSYFKYKLGFWVYL